MGLFRKKSIDKIVADAAAGNSDGHNNQHGLQKVLGVRDLTFMGIAAVIGAGIFSTIGTAAFNGGPGLFVITAVTCGFCALCYAEFASRVPIAGSAYTYAYVSFGELIAWIIGWALILEYAIGNIVVAISWSGYFNNLLMGLGIHLPEWLLIDPFTQAENVASGSAKAIALQAAAPSIAGFKLFINLPAFLIVCVISVLAYIGIQESRKSTNAMVIFKLLVIVLVVVLGFFYVDTQNWKPFLPNGFTGVLAGVSAVFYAYIGFDAISTTAEECKNPQQDLPKGMLYSLIVCTILYILIALVLTGMVNYTELKVNDPLAYVFEKLNLPWVQYIISISAVIATTSVMLVFQLGQPRIWMSMSRDGLLPKKFATVHPKFKTPSFATIVTGFLVAIPSLFLPSSLMTDLTSIGTLFAFVLVCFGVLVLPKINAKTQGFKLPYINGKFIIPVLVAVFIYFSMGRVQTAFAQLGNEGYQEVLFLLFVLIAVVVAVLSFVRNYSVIPILGALCCLYLLIEIPAISWLWFFVWMGLGLLVYGLYGYKKSVLSKR
jgi:basic amino acid/polyamine antiporter, APA family